MMHYAKSSHETTTCEVTMAHKGDLVTIAKFYAYGSTRVKRKEYAETLADMFITALTEKHRPKATLKTIARAVRRGSYRWNTSRTAGYKLAGLITLACDAILRPGRYTNDRNSDAQGSVQV